MHISPSFGYFPNEIYAEILQYLHHRQDKNILLSLALVSQVLRHESQKILFSIVDGKAVHERGKDEDTIRRHTLFLQTVIDHPKRLGLYVLSYAQENLACDPKGKLYLLRIK
jgi:hypothetical protein